MKEKMERNLRILPIERFFREIHLFGPFLVAIYATAGVNLATTMLLQSAFFVTILLAEIPTAVVADRWGKKRSLLFASALYFLAVVAFFSFRNFWGFLLGESLAGISMAFLSGADSALQFETLKALGKEKKNLSYQSHFTALGRAAAILAMFLTMPIIAGFGVWGLVLFQIPVKAAHLLVTFFLSEPPTAKTSFLEEEKKKTAAAAFRFLAGHAEIRRFLPFSLAIGVAVYLGFWTHNPFWQANEIPEASWGLILVALNGVALLTNLALARWPRLASSRRVKLALLLLGPLGFAALTLKSGWLGAFLFPAVFQIIRGIKDPMVSDFIDQRSSSEFRATAMSTFKMAGNLTNAAAGPLLGWAVGAFGFATAALMTAGVLLATAGPAFWLVAKNGRK